MPKYDPDATVTELTLTIPMWISSIQRMEASTNFEKVSDNAKEMLEKALVKLQEAIKKPLTTLTEDKNG